MNSAPHTYVLPTLTTGTPSVVLGHPAHAGAGHAHAEPVAVLRVLCVDEQPLVVEGLRRVFALDQGFQVVGHVISAEDLPEQVGELKPDVVISEVELHGRDALEALAEVRRRFPAVRLVLLAGHVRDHTITAALRVGVHGFFDKYEDIRSLVAGLRRACTGPFTCSPRVSQRCRHEPGLTHPGAGHDVIAAAQPVSKLDALTRREQEVLRLIGQGLSRTQIAHTLHRSPKTIDGHRERLMQKLDIHSGPELVRFAIREGLTEA
jgi:DNA-binding NarL/FixJ family response regulator